MPLDTRPGTTPANIGEYDVLEKIAEGGMGAVFKARSRQTGDLVAISYHISCGACDRCQERA